MSRNPVARLPNVVAAIMGFVIVASSGYSETLTQATCRVIAFGDSITDGVREGVTTEQTYATLLGAALRAEDFHFDVVRSGVGNEHTGLALSRFEKDVVAHRPAVVLIMYGTNDSFVYKGKTNPDLAPSQYRSNLESLVRRSRSAGIHPILMTSPPWGRRAELNPLGKSNNELLKDFVAICRDVATKESVPLVDHFDLWLKPQPIDSDPGDWTTDQCHPNPEGHRRIAEAILPVLKVALKQLADAGLNCPSTR